MRRPANCLAWCRSSTTRPECRFGADRALEGVKGPVRNPGDRLYPTPANRPGGQDQVRLSGFRRRHFGAGTRIGDALPRAARTWISRKCWSTNSRSSTRHWAMLLESSSTFPTSRSRATGSSRLDLLKNLKRDFLEQAKWAPVEETSEGVIVGLHGSRSKSRARASSTTCSQALEGGVSGHHQSRVCPDHRPVFRRQRRSRIHGRQFRRRPVVDLDQDEMGEGEVLAMTFPRPPTTSWSNWSTRSSSTPTSRAPPTSTSNPASARTRCWSASAGTVRWRSTSRCRPAIAARLVARLKIMCDLDISERRKPQDGKIKFKKFGPLDIELRVATMPTAGGVEDVVMRILAAGEPIPLDKLGVLPTNLGKLKSTPSPSRMACSSCAARPVPARPPRCIPCSAT
jgi:hypothetical protein